MRNGMGTVLLSNYIGIPRVFTKQILHYVQNNILSKILDSLWIIHSSFDLLRANEGVDRLFCLFTFSFGCNCKLHPSGSQARSPHHNFDAGRESPFVLRQDERRVVCC
jgi:hypothetical protein